MAGAPLRTIQNNQGPVSPYGSRLSTGASPGFGGGGAGSPGSAAGVVPRPITGGGEPLDIDQAVAVSRPRAPGEWLGLNEAIAADKLSPLESPDCLNNVANLRRGACSARMGIAKMSVHATNEDVIGIAPLLLKDGDGKALLLVASWDGSQTEIEAIAPLLTIPSVREPTVKPTISLACTTTTLTVTASAVTSVGGVEKLFVRASTEGFPTAPWGYEGTNGDLGDSEDWDGQASGDIAITHGQAATTPLFVTAWYANRLGLSPPAYGKITVPS